MKKSILLYLVLSVIFLVRCKTAPKELEENEILNAKSLIEVVNVTYGTVDDELTFSASTIYLNRNVITATIPSFITRVRVKLGDAVSKGDILFELESKEKRALGKSGAQLDSSLTKFGMVEIRASASGVISTLDKQQAGDYVLEGTQLCTIAESSDLAFQVNVPYEFTAYTRQGNACTIQLPDGTLHQATFTKALTGMNTMAQTQTILAKVNEAVFLPENMIVKVSVIKGSSSKRQLLPKSCILSDEMMEEFWVMKLVNDSTAIKIPIVRGNENALYSEVISPLFNLEDRIISVGNYGLSDTASVKMVVSK